MSSGVESVVFQARPAVRQSTACDSPRQYNGHLVDDPCSHHQSLFPDWSGTMHSGSGLIMAMIVARLETTMALYRTVQLEPWAHDPQLTDLIGPATVCAPSSS